MNLIARLDALTKEVNHYQLRCREYEVNVENWQMKYFEILKDDASKNGDELDFLSKLVHYVRQGDTKTGARKQDKGRTNTPLVEGESLLIQLFSYRLSFLRSLFDFFLPSFSFPLFFSFFRSLDEPWESRLLLYRFLRASLEESESDRLFLFRSLLLVRLRSSLREP